MSAIKNARGQWGQALAEEWLKTHGFQIQLRNWRPDRSLGAGEVDLLARRGWDLWFFEVKCHQRQFDVPLITRHQISRLRRSMKAWKALPQPPNSSSCTLRLALLWVDPKSGHIVFLENPC